MPVDARPPRAAARRSRPPRSGTSSRSGRAADLLVAGRGQRARLAQDLARRRAALAAAGVGHHAEGAELVAAALDGDVADDAVAAGGAGSSPRRSRRGRATVSQSPRSPLARRARRARAAAGSRRGRPPGRRSGARSRILSLRCSAMQPVMPSTTPGRALLVRASSLARANTRSSAFSRTAQVLMQDRGRRRRRRRCARSRARRAGPASGRVSATFIWQP